MEKLLEERFQVIDQIKASHEKRVKKAVDYLRTADEMKKYIWLLQDSFQTLTRSKYFSEIRRSDRENATCAYHLLLNFLIELQTVEALISKERELRGV